MKRGFVWSIFIAMCFQLLDGALSVGQLKGSEKIAPLTTREGFNAAVKFIRRKPLSEREKAALKKVTISAVLVAAVAAITGLTAAYVKNRLETAQKERQLGPDLSSQQYRFTPRTSIEAIARNYGEIVPTDASPKSLLVRGALGGDLNMVKNVTDLVFKNVLLIGRDVAQSEIDKNPDPKKMPVYNQIVSVLQHAIDHFNELQVKKNLMFIRSALARLDAEVRQTICSVSPNAIKEALEQLKYKIGKNEADRNIEKILKEGCRER